MTLSVEHEQPAADIDATAAAMAAAVNSLLNNSTTTIQQFKDPMAPWHYRPATEIITSPTFYIPFIISAIACFIWYITTVHILFKPHFKTPRQKAWVLTLLSSVVMVIAGAQLAYEFIILPAGSTVADHPSLDSPHAWGLAGFFLAYLVVDSIVGCIEYPSQFGWISGWFHHSGYAWCVFALMQRGQVGAFLAFGAMLETSTVPLALGHINKKWRQDYLFGFL
ncbi:hypothetical protein HDU76_013185 [Blyttiomyces sp. JEL0837]|nr:hypothetical protein HDU76_013185 [Blyttiomyces sp. JEL0837]